MTHSQSATPRRASRLGLYGPFVAVAIALVAWSGGWWWLRGQVLNGLAALAGARAAAGGGLTWRSTEVHGYPFRIDVDFKDIAWREPTGWAVAAPLLKSETSVFALGHWVAYAPLGLVIGRPDAGEVRIAAKAIRASLSDGAARPPNLAFEALGLSFAPAPGAAGYFLTSAAALRFYTRPGPNDQGAVYFAVEGAQASPGGALAHLAGGKPVNLAAEATYDHAGALAGPSWSSTVETWALAGGTLALRRLRLQAGDVALEAHGSGLAADADGRLTGTLEARLAHGEEALSRLAQGSIVDPAAARLGEVVLRTAPAPANVRLVFQAGRTTLGPVALAAAPKVY